MPAYDFRSLNDKDFEEVVVDLLGVVHSVRIERFKPGKDKGIDGRFFAADGTETIIQCKHYAASGYKKLLADLQKKELPKIRKLDCTRYIVATSVPLSRDNKEELKVALAPYVGTATDIYGAEDLNDLLAKNPEIESRHYRLWLASVVALGAVFNNAVLGRSRAELDAIREAAPLYVATHDYTRAVSRLVKESVVILTGQPGIGKTTLARQLILSHAAQGFELVSIEDDLTEAESVFAPARKQFFYYDDFLGRTYLDALTSKKDSHIVGFINRIAADPTKRFVLTSRTGILNQGAATSDIFADLLVRRRPFELRVDHIAPLDRARMLYNHMWYSTLGLAYKEELYIDKRYLTLVKHPNFNPRLIAFILDFARVGDVPPGDYWALVENTLANPSAVWDHVFDQQLDQNARDLVYLVVVNGSGISETELSAAFAAVPARVGAHAGAVERDFRRAEKAAAGSVLQRNVDARSGRVTYDVFNPSVADYVEYHLATASSNLWSYYIGCLRSRTALDKLANIHRRKRISSPRYVSTLGAVIQTEATRTLARDDYTWRVLTAAAGDAECAVKYQAFIRDTLLTPPSPEEIKVADYLALIRCCERFVDKPTAQEFAGALPAVLELEPAPIDESELLNAVFTSLRRIGADEVASSLRNDVIESWSEYASQGVRDSGVLGASDDSSQLDEAERAVRSYLDEQLLELGVELDDSELDTLASWVNVESIIEADIAADAQADQHFEEWRERRQEQAEQIERIEDLFDRS